VQGTKAMMAVLLLAAPLVASASDEVPIQEFVRHPQYSSTKISPDGRFLALTMQQGETMSLAVLTLADMKVIRITRLTNGESVGAFYWVGPNRLMYTSARNFGSYASPFGTGVWYAMDADGGHPRTLLSYNAGAADGRSKMLHYTEQFSMLDPLPEDESKALMQLSDFSDGGRNQVVSVDTMTGHRQVLAKAPREDCRFVVDSAHTPRYANCSETKDAERGYDEHNELYRLESDGSWTRVEHAKDDARELAVQGIAPDGRIYAYAGGGKRPDAFGLLSADTNAFTTLLQDPVAEIDHFLYGADGDTIVGAVTMAGAPHVELLDKSNPDLAVYSAMSQAFPGELVDIGSATRDGKKMIVSVHSDVDPGQLYLFDRDTGSVRFLMKSLPALDPARMAHRVPFSFQARDGQTVYGYLTVPQGKTGALPTIIHPHGGPIGVRDDWSFDSESQLLASRGYLVVQVNFRGSGGYGKAFVDAGYGEWGGKMQDDLTDATRWVAAQGYADPKRVCIYGASYGGYAAMMGVATQQALYKCGVGYVGVYDLELWSHKSDVADRAEGRRYIERAFGTDIDVIHRRSPARLADKISAPVFIAVGLKDPRVPHSQADAMVSALKAAGHPPEVLIEEPAEMHGFYDEDANLNLYTKMLAFFDKYIGPGSASGAGSH